MLNCTLKETLIVFVIFNLLVKIKSNEKNCVENTNHVVLATVISR